MRIQWNDIRPNFVQFLKSEDYTSGYQRDLLSYLDRYVSVIDSPTDIIELFAGVESGRRHLWLALRVLFNCLEAMGYPTYYLNALRKALPKVECGVDLKVPSKGDILDSLKKLPQSAPKYQVLYHLLVDSGLRLVEAVKIINEFDVENVNRINGFYRVPLGEFRGSKQAFYGYFTKFTFNRITSLENLDSLKPRNASHYYWKYEFTAPKYLRKFAFDRMISLNIPERVADFIEGRVPKRIGAKHYMALRKQADTFYKKYANYITEVRYKA